LDVLALGACSGIPAPASARPTAAPRSLSEFAFLRPGMGYDEIVGVAGEPDRDVGSGLYVFVYRLDDGTELELTFASLEQLLSVSLYDPGKGTRQSIPGPE
jgi:hypothetical protein